MAQLILFFVVVTAAVFTAEAVNLRPQERDEQLCLKSYADKLDTVRRGLGTSIRSHPLKRDKVSGRSVIFGAGSGHSGTRSLWSAMKLIGVSGWHWEPNQAWERKIMDAYGWHVKDFHKNKTAMAECVHTLRTMDYSDFPADVQFMADEPIAEVFVDLYTALPNSKFILTERPYMEWAVSRRSHHGKREAAPLQEPCGLTVNDFSDEQLAAMEQYKNEFVKCILPKDRLMVINVWEDSDYDLDHLMETLARFSNVDVSTEGLEYPSRGLKAIRLASAARDDMCQAAMTSFLATGRNTTGHFGQLWRHLARKGCELGSSN